MTIRARPGGHAAHTGSKEPGSVLGASRRRGLEVLILVVAALLAACSINLQLPLSQQDQQAAGTIVAQTLEALGTPAASPGATQSKPMLAITGNSNCRTGPGGSFKIVTAFTPGTNLELVGKDTANNYWEVKVPNSETTCWVWGKYATASGGLDSLSESAQTSSGSGAPARPGSLYYQYTCPFGNLTTSLSWSDSADNESGYHVYRFDLLIADLPANSTSYTDVETVTPHADLQYSVEAYNSAGVSAQRTISFRCE